MSQYAYTEDQLVEQPAIGLFAAMGWQTVSRLRDLELLEMKGAGSRTYYVPGARFVAQSTVNPAVEVLGNPHHPPQNTHQVLANTHQLSANTHQLITDLPELLRAKLPGSGTKPRKGVVQTLIRELCAGRALSAREIAVLLGGRDQKHLVREFLSPMVHAGLLAYTIAEMENHPDQRYTVPPEVTNNGAATP